MVSRLSFGYSGDINTTLKSWVPKLRNIVARLATIEENLSLVGYKVTGIAIPAGTEAEVKHALGAVPTMIIITYVNGGVVEHGTTAYTEDAFYLKNKSSSESATVDVLVIK